MTTTRRQFLRRATQGLGFLAAAAALPRWVGNAHAATLAGYSGSRVAVCVFLLGGNDSNNILIPREANAYAKYLAARPTIGLKTDQLDLINPTDLAAGSFALPKTLSKLRAHFEAGRAAFVCNVGPLVLPLTKADYLAGGTSVPENLFSHSDQQDAWASALANPGSSTATSDIKVTGWGGRAADKLHVLNTSTPPDYPEVTSFGGKPRFCAGVDRKPMMVAPDGTLAFRTVNTPPSDFDLLQQAALADVMTVQDGNVLETAYAGVFTTAQTFSSARAAARDAAWAQLPQATRDAIEGYFVPTLPPEDTAKWTLHTQLYQVVRDLVAGAMPVSNAGLGLKRQVFSVGFGSFDTHQNQDVDQPKLLEQLDFALDAFQKSVTLLETQAAFGSNAPQATLFTMSDFNRTLLENGDSGTDHAWGGHAIVLGNRVAGKKLYGTFPDLDLSGSLDGSTDERGRWIPTLTVEQYGWTLASWLGLNTAAERDYVFPNLSGYLADAVARGFPAQARRAKVGFMLAD
ncbi:DUF1501 domain-containing protein [Corallococcus sp. CA049B]|uniref:DUF1501 domain-containing protein n=1 Tax=Corallococcus sp. CA049B TaxID=2316730 RepID=UPI000EA2E0BE|nr:DUF1501 domain-containing protein [Corallococcus sp. CA049B]NOJ92854.1 DUF1501 domain-containing protein [Corallococcus coralloides]RKG82905.1 DUF1501 domain-containing protein [Corallococcus sp. CA049B]